MEKILFIRHFNGSYLYSQVILIKQLKRIIIRYVFVQIRALKISKSCLLPMIKIKVQAQRLKFTTSKTFKELP